jgi:hypothetical protein
MPLRTCRSESRSGDRLGKALEAVDHRDEDIVDAPCLELVDYLEPELGSFGLFALIWFATPTRAPQQCGPQFLGGK